MGVLDKIKNALFEVEYVEVEEPPEKEKKVKEKKVKEKKDSPKPIAKKIVLPGRKEEKIEELHEEELKDEDFEIRPKDENVKQVSHEEFKFMDDNDFKVEEEYPMEEPKILSVVPDKKNEDIVDEENSYVEYDHDSRQDDYYSPPSYSREEYRSSRVSHESRPYGVDNSYNVSIHEYGTYEKKEEKAYFRPSPIISPIYGILDKNYKKEDVKEKREVRITSSYTRTNVSVDDIRNKAYGRRSQVEDDIDEDTTKFEVEEQDDDLLVDLSDRSKPEVKELTMGDAEEYFQDLGLEYNVDYVDVSTDRSTTPKKEESKESPKHEAIKKLEEEKVEEEKEDIYEEEPVVDDVKEVIEDKEKVETDDDNLFDLIDSMYEE